jgi:hypothetical protein
MNFASCWKTGVGRHVLGSLLLASIAAVLGNGARAGDFSPHDLAFVDRLTWGITASSAEHFRSVGLDRWLAEQLHPPGNFALPEAVKSQIAVMPDANKFPFDIAVAFEAQAKSANQVVDPDQKKAAQQVYQGAMNDRAKQAAARTILRALYSPDQLRERMTWFWFNHFNLHHGLGVTPTRLYVSFAPHLPNNSAARSATPVAHRQRVIILARHIRAMIPRVIR